MTRGPATTLAAYARTIERWWTEFLDAPVVLSPRDWNLITEWYESGVPLAIVREALDDAAERARGRRSRSAPRGLGYLAKAVAEGRSALQDGRVREVEPRSGPASPTAASAGPTPAEETASGIWRRRAAEEPAGSALRGLLERVVSRLDAGDPPSELDALVDAELEGVLPQSLLREVEKEIARRLEPFRRRMDPGTLESTRRKATALRLRERLDLPRLSD